MQQATAPENAGFPLASAYRFPEDVRVVPIVVPELKFRDVERQVLPADLVVRADDPALKQAPEAFNRVGVDRAHDVRAGVFFVPVRDDFMRQAARLQELVALPVVRAEQADAVRNGVLNEACQGRCADVVDHAGDDAALAAHGTRHDGLTARSGAGRFVLVVVPLAGVLVADLAAHERLIDFDDAEQLTEVFVGEPGADAVRHVPGGFVRAESHVAVKLEGADALLAGQHQVNDLEPVFEGLVGVLEDGPGDVREAVSATLAARGALPLPLHGFERIDRIAGAAGAHDPVRPALGDQVSRAGVLIRELFVELSGGKLLNFARFAHAERYNPSTSIRQVRDNRPRSEPS